MPIEFLFGEKETKTVGDLEKKRSESSPSFFIFFLYFHIFHIGATKILT